MAIVEIRVHGRTVRMLDDGDRVIAHHRMGGFEPMTSTAWALAIERRPGLALDVGAYTGYYAILAARCGARDVVAIEPHYPNIRRMQANCCINGVALQIIEGAASDGIGFGRFSYNAAFELTSGGTLEAPERRTGVRDVPLFEIDALALSAVSAIKIDVEGHEPHVIRGALNIVRRDRPMLIVEVLSSAALEAVTALLPDYTMTAVLDDRNAVFEPRN